MDRHKILERVTCRKKHRTPSSTGKTITADLETHALVEAAPTPLSFQLPWRELERDSHMDGNSRGSYHRTACRRRQRTPCASFFVRLVHHDLSHTVDSPHRSQYELPAALRATTAFMKSLCASGHHGFPSCHCSSVQGAMPMPTLGFPNAFDRRSACASQRSSSSPMSAHQISSPRASRLATPAPSPCREDQVIPMYRIRRPQAHHRQQHHHGRDRDPGRTLVCPL